MGVNRQNRRAGQPWRVLLALACVLLVVVSGAIQVAHTHADGPDTHANCSLCVTAHIAVQVVQTPVPAPTAAVVAVLESAPISVTPSALCTFALFTRPPPVDTFPA